MIDKIIEKLPLHFISCQEATRLISLGMERKLSFKERFDLKVHLCVCDLCTRFSKQIHQLRQLLRNYKPMAEKQLPADWKIRIKDKLAAENK